MNFNKKLEKLFYESAKEAADELLRESAASNEERFSCFANPVYPMVKEVRTTENPDEISEKLNSGNWVALNGINDRGVLKLMLGRINPLQEGREER